MNLIKTLTSLYLFTYHVKTYKTYINKQLIDSNVRVKCLGGRELRGALRGYDELVNLVLDDCEEFLRGTYI